MNGSKHGKPRAAWPLEPGGLIGLLTQGWGEEGERILPEPCTKQAPKKKKTPMPQRLGPDLARAARQS